MQLKAPALCFGKAKFTVTNGDDLKKWANPNAIPTALAALQDDVTYWNKTDIFTRKLDTIPNELELELSYSRATQFGANSFAAVASSPQIITVYEVDSEKPGERKLFEQAPYFTQDLGSWMDASSGEMPGSFAVRTLQKLNELLAPPAEKPADGPKA